MTLTGVALLVEICCLHDQVIRIKAFRVVTQVRYLYITNVLAYLLLCYRALGITWCVRSGGQVSLNNGP
jgi:hypothetical protein